MDGLVEGRVVHYVVTDGEHRAAIIVDVHDQFDGTVELNVFWKSVDPEWTKVYTPITWVQFDAERKRPGTWHWIEKSLGQL